jgi:hypothetical protein
MAGTVHRSLDRTTARRAVATPVVFETLTFWQRRCHLQPHAARFGDAR